MIAPICGVAIVLTGALLASGSAMGGPGMATDPPQTTSSSATSPPPAEPEAPTVEPNPPIVEPEAPIVEPEASIVEPNAPAAAPACPGAVCTSLTVEGLSHVATLDSDIILAPGRFDAVAFFDGPDPEWPLRLEGDLRLPPVDAYFVIFRFMPSTSTVVFLADGKATGRGRIVTPPGVNCDGLCVEVDLVVKLFIQLRNVTQDGVPIDVGGNCATAVPATIPLKGVIAGIGGPGGTKSTIETTYEIPRFGGCGATEELDPLITGLVSGPGNLLKNTLTTLPPEPAP